MTTTTNPAQEAFRLPVDDELGALIERFNEDLAAMPYSTDDVEAHFVNRLALEASVDARRTVYGLMREIRAKVRQVEDQEAWLRTIAAEVTAANAKRQRTIEFLSEQAKRIAKDLIPEGKKSVDVPGIGRIQWRKVPEAVVISDEDALLAWIKEQDPEQGLSDYIRVKEEVKKGEVKPVLLGIFKDDGELPAGTEYQAEVALGSSSIQWEQR